MAMIISCISNKGGVGKSMLSRLIATGYAKEGRSVLLADLGTRYNSSLRWHERRTTRDVRPTVSVEKYGSLDVAVQASSKFDVMIIDGDSNNARHLRETAAISRLVLVPSSSSMDDLEPTFEFMDDLGDYLSTERLSTKRAGMRYPKKLPVGLRHGHLCLCRLVQNPSKIPEDDLQRMIYDYNLIEGFLPEKFGYQKASDAGFAANETKFITLNDRANRIFNEVKQIIEFEENGYSSKEFNRINRRGWMD